MSDPLLAEGVSPLEPRAEPARRRGRILAELRLTAHLDVVESFRARWFGIYSLVFGGVVALLFAFGLTESRILGFLGLSRLLVSYIQLCMAVLPIFVLVTTVRSVAGDREAGIYEYLLSLPVSLGAWFWGKLLGRFVVTFLPAFGAMLAAAGWARLQEIPVPWGLFALYTLLLGSLTACFLGIGLLISSLARSVDGAQGAAFVLWLGLVLLLDLLLLGLLLEERIGVEPALAIALLNPLQAFRTAALLLFDPELFLLGAPAWVALELLGRTGLLLWSTLYPALLGLACAGLGFLTFRRGDLP